MTTQQPLKVIISEAIGPFVIGASIHSILSRLKTDPSTWPKLHIKYSPSEPLLYPIIVDLPANGLRLNFDPAEQRLRFIEVLDFGKVQLQHGDSTINKSAGNDSLPVAVSQSAGPDFKRVYKEFGPANPGEYLGEDGKRGTYCISFKEGIAFLFPVDAPEDFSKRDFARQIAVLDSQSCKPATSMTVFRGRSWPLARQDIYTADMSDLLLTPFEGSRKDSGTAEIDFAHIQDRGRIELVRRGAPSLMLRLGETTPQDLLTELGPPDSMHRKQSNPAQQKRRTSSSSSRRSAINLDSDRTSENEGSDMWSDEEDEPEETTVVNELDRDGVGTWWNYYSHGLDILISQAQEPPTRSPTAPPSPSDEDEDDTPVLAKSHLTATKICIHSNVPGSYQFNRHRRLRWSLDSWPLPLSSSSTISQLDPAQQKQHQQPLTSETKFPTLQTHLCAVFAGTYASPLEEQQQQEPQAVNRDWGETSALGNSVELLGGWEGGGGGSSAARKNGGGSGSESEATRIGEVLIYGFPGLGFEVLRNGVVGSLQVW